MDVLAHLLAPHDAVVDESAALAAVQRRCAQDAGFVAHLAAQLPLLDSSTPSSPRSALDELLLCALQLTPLGATTVVPIERFADLRR